MPRRVGVPFARRAQEKHRTKIEWAALSQIALSRRAGGGLVGHLSDVCTTCDRAPPSRTAVHVVEDAYAAAPPFRVHGTSGALGRDARHCCSNAEERERP